MVQQDGRITIGVHGPPLAAAGAVRHDVMKWLAGFILFTGLVAAIDPGAAANERLSMRVSPAVAFAPANLVVRTQIAADEANRSIEIVAESEDFYRSSEIQLDGERAPRTSVFEFRSLPSGFYAVRAVLKGQGGREIAATQTLVTLVDGMTSGR
jgi:hypothetical protein